jgi:hypothetical protein
MMTEPPPPRSESGEPRRDASREVLGSSERKPGDTLVEDTVSLLDGVVEYLATIFRLERYRFEARTRRFIQKLLILVLGAAVLLAGLVFISVGISSLLSEWIGVPYAGPLIVGGAYAAVGLIVILVVGRKGED